MSFTPSQTSGDHVPTETRLLAVTTRFTPPPDSDCAIRDFTRDNPEYDTNYYLYSDPLDQRFTACQPEGWADRPSSLRFSFSPAVCPSEWTWSSIQLTRNNHNETITTALCCAEDFSLRPIWDAVRSTYGSYCSSWIYRKTVKGTFSHGTGTKSKITSGSMIHDPWHITWRETDRAQLTPAPPLFTSGTTAISSWNGEGTLFPTSSAPPEEHDLQGLQSIAMFVYIGVPLIALFLFGGCVYCCCAGANRQKEVRRRPAAANDVDALRYNIQMQAQEARPTNDGTRV